MIAIGLMSGTSADGVDAAAVELAVPASGVRVLATASRPYEPTLRATLRQVAEGRPTDARALTRLHAALGREYAELARRLRDAIARDGATAEVVAVHGQTIGHLPDEGATLQIGDAAKVAAATGLPTVGDFRSADVAAGGQGAPLVPFGDRILFGRLAPVAVLNVGGIANLTLVPTDRAEDVVAFDTGPGNMVIDRVAAIAGDDMDRGGVRAARGRVDERLLGTAMRHPYFARRAPKSTGREDFGEAFARPFLDLASGGGAAHDDALATATELTARTIALGLARATPAPPPRVLVAGGGASNAHLMARLRAALAPAAVEPTDAAGIPARYREAIVFAILGAYRLRGLANTLPGATGARRAVSGGALHIP